MGASPQALSYTAQRRLARPCRPAAILQPAPGSTEPSAAGERPIERRRLYFRPSDGAAARLNTSPGGARPGAGRGGAGRGPVTVDRPTPGGCPQPALFHGQFRRRRNSIGSPVTSKPSSERRWAGRGDRRPTPRTGRPVPASAGTAAAIHGAAARAALGRWRDWSEGIVTAAGSHRERSTAELVSETQYSRAIGGCERARCSGQQTTIASNRKL